MPSKLYDATIALAGIFQAAILIRDLAKLGVADPTAFDASINSLYKINVEKTEEVFGELNHLKIGLQKLIDVFDRGDYKSDPEINTYLISFIYLERKLSQDREVDSILTNRIKYVTSQANYFSPTHPQVIATLADIYMKTVGTFRLRVKIVGNPVYLSILEISNKIRALLLAGVRAAVLWQQVGGSRWQLLFSRKAMVSTAKQILSQIKA